MCLRTVVIPTPLGTSFLGHPSGRAARSYRAWLCTTTLSSSLLKAPPPTKQAHGPVPTRVPHSGGPAGVAGCQGEVHPPEPAGVSPPSLQRQPPALLQGPTASLRQLRRAGPQGSRRHPETHRPGTSCSTGRDRQACTHPGRSWAHHPTGAPSSRKGDGVVKRSLLHT